MVIFLFASVGMSPATLRGTTVGGSASLSSEPMMGLYSLYQQKESQARRMNLFEISGKLTLLLVP